MRIVHGTLIDGRGSEPIPNPGIDIRDNRIVGLGEPIDDDDQVIDASGQYIMPGMIDGHVHISSHQGDIGIKEQTGPEFATLWTARILPRILRAGVTGISVPGGRHFVDVTVRDCVDAGFLVGPRIFTAARALGPVGGIFNGGMKSWNDDAEPDSVGIACLSTDDYIREIRRQHRRGVDLIKIADDYWGDIQGFSQENLNSIVDETHRLGLKIAIHSRGAGTTRAAALAGFDWIYHADLATRDDLEVVRDRGIPIMPVFTGAAMAHGLGWGDRLGTQLAQQIEAIKLARSIGIEILSGTDSGNAATFQHGQHHGNEPAHLVNDVGLTPLEAIETVTRRNARTIGLAGEVGTIEEGMLADITIWSQNPADDITVLQRQELLTAVVKDGQLVVSQGRFVPQPDTVMLPLSPEPSRNVS
ncbi:MAG: hypothetical protein CL424_06210 [Acidimicrobiaceae bacterium]|nr:hypothetical protein [Acidimicrobiaceae bacterium]